MAAGEKTHVRVASSSPGRVRLRVHPAERSPERMEKLRERLEAHPDVQSVEVNPQTGSVLVRGESTQKLKAALGQLVEQVEQAGPERLPEVAAVELVKRLNSRVNQASQGRLSLSWAVPALFVGFGLRQLLLEGLTLGAVPWYVLIYYGVDSFIKLNPEHAPRVEPVGAQPATPPAPTSGQPAPAETPQPDGGYR
jgi:Heavy metal associated domain 2